MKNFINRSFYLKKFVVFFNRKLIRFRAYQLLHFKIAINKINLIEEKKLSPKRLYLETTNYCNAKCIMCPHPNMIRDKGFMDMELFFRIVDDAIRNNISLIGLSFLGEPLIDQNLIDRIKYIKIKSPATKVIINTNASLLTANLSEKIIDAGLDEIRVSFDAFNKETYEKIRIGLKYDEVIDNIENLISEKDKSKSLAPIIKLAYVDIDFNHAEAKKFYNYWRRKVDIVEIDLARDWANQTDVNSKESVHIADIPLWNPCDVLWNEMVVQYDGKVVLCCNDYEGKVVLGDLRKEKISDVWWGEKIKRFRKMNLNARKDGLLLCGQCNKYSFWW